MRFKEKGSELTVIGPDGKAVKQNPLRLSVPLFPDKVLYVGFNAAPKAAPEVSAFSIRISSLGKFTLVTPTDSQTQSPPLHELAHKRGFQIGAMTIFESLRTTSIFTREFNRLISEDFHWSLIRPSKTGYDFSRTDMIVEFANRNRIPVEAHPLVWGADDHLPDWLKNGNFTREELLNILHEHINTVATRYKGKISAWSIANEVTSRTVWGDRKWDFWYKNIGPDYVELAFRWAREADPNAVLILNDDNNEGRQTQNNIKIAEAMYELVKKLKKRVFPLTVWECKCTCYRHLPMKKGVLRKKKK